MFGEPEDSELDSMRVLKGSPLDIEGESWCVCLCVCGFSGIWIHSLIDLFSSGKFHIYRKVNSKNKK